MPGRPSETTAARAGAPHAGPGRKVSALPVHRVWERADATGAGPQCRAPIQWRLRPSVQPAVREAPTVVAAFREQDDCGCETGATLDDLQLAISYVAFDLHVAEAAKAHVEQESHAALTDRQIAVGDVMARESLIYGKATGYPLCEIEQGPSVLIDGVDRVQRRSSGPGMPSSHTSSTTWLLTLRYVVLSSSKSVTLIHSS